MNLGADLLHLQPRDELERLRRASVFLPRSAGDALNEQYAWAQLHALNEAEIGAAPAGARESAAASIAVPLATHWTRILHHDLFAANVRDLDPEEREVFDAQDIRALMTVPIFVRGEWWGLRPVVAVVTAKASSGARGGRGA